MILLFSEATGLARAVPRLLKRGELGSVLKVGDATAGDEGLLYKTISVVT